MNFGLGLLGYHGCWDDAAFAEQHGFTMAGFVDSPLLAADPFVPMALTAERTSGMALGPFLGVPSSRPALTMASTLATLNRLAPGRVFGAFGTGNTSRGTFGLPALSARRLHDYTRECRALLDGEEVRPGEPPGPPIRLLHEDDRHVSLAPSIPLHVAADGPKALAVAGAIADGWITTLQYANTMENAPAVLADGLRAVQSARTEAGRPANQFEVTWSTTMCILRPGERPTAQRVLERVGAHAMLPFHAYADNPRIGEHLPPFIASRLAIYESEVLRRFDPVRRHQEIHRGHLSHLLPGEAAVLTDEIVRATCLVGTAEEIAEVLRSLEAAGLTRLALWLPPGLTREAVIEVSEQLVPRLAGKSGTPKATRLQIPAPSTSRRMSLQDLVTGLSDLQVHDVSPTIEPGMPMFFLHPAPEMHPISEHATAGAAANRISLSEHTGSHVDAPYHFDPTGLTVDLLAADALLMRPYKKFDLSSEDPQPGETIDRRGLIAAQERGGFTLQPGDVAIIEMGWDRHYPDGSDEHQPGWWGSNQPGLAADACEHLAQTGVTAVASDTVACDIAVKEGKIISAPGHGTSFLPRGILIVEGLRHLAAVPATGLLVALPLKLAGGSGSPLRVVLITE